jgi:formamidopyrimidine-DNA glycosylase
MPELPEVETVARTLREQLVGRKITEVEVFWERTIDRPDPATFCSLLTGARVDAVGRRGKFITVQFDTGHTMLTHLRMTGKFLIEPVPSDDAHARVRFLLDDGRPLVFSDTRKFGRMFLVSDPLQVLGQLGPEPLAKDFTPARLGDMLAERRGRIKPLLLNQTFIAGLGNIYADEALWRARVHPLQHADTLTPDQAARLHAGILDVLIAAIGEGGTSLRDNQYRQPDGEGGAYQDLLAVYGRAGQGCLRCGTPVKRIVVAQRGTHYCPGCQKLVE